MGRFFKISILGAATMCLLASNLRADNLSDAMEVRLVHNRIKVLEESIRTSSDKDAGKFISRGLLAGLIVGGLLNELDIWENNWFILSSVVGTVSSMFIYAARHSEPSNFIKKVRLLRQLRKFMTKANDRPSYEWNMDLLVDIEDSILLFAKMAKDNKLRTSFERWEFLKLASAYLNTVAKNPLKQTAKDRIEVVRELSDAVFRIWSEALNQRDLPLAKIADKTKDLFQGCEIHLSRDFKLGIHDEAQIKLEKFYLRYVYSYLVNARDAKYNFSSASGDRMLSVSLPIKNGDPVQVFFNRDTWSMDQIQDLWTNGEIQKEMAPGLWVRVEESGQYLWHYFLLSESPARFKSFGVPVEVAASWWPSEANRWTLQPKDLSQDSWEKVLSAKGISIRAFKTSWFQTPSGYSCARWLWLASSGVGG